MTNRPGAAARQQAQTRVPEVQAPPKGRIPTSLHPHGTTTKLITVTADVPHDSLAAPHPGSAGSEWRADAVGCSLPSLISLRTWRTSRPGSPRRPGSGRLRSWPSALSADSRLSLAAIRCPPPGSRPSCSSSFASPSAHGRAERRRVLARQRQPSHRGTDHERPHGPACHDRTAAGVQARADHGSMPPEPVTGTNRTCTEPLLRRQSRSRRPAPPGSCDDHADGDCQPRGGRGQPLSPAWAESARPSGVPHPGPGCRGARPSGRRR